MINHPNRSKLYTVLNYDGDVEDRGCTVEDAAFIVMGYDGHEFEIRAEEDGEGFRLWTTDYSRNSTGYRGLTKSVLFSLEDDHDAAEADIYRQVIENAEWWKGCDVKLDADYDEMMAELAQDNE